jgi:hypothetical protein
VKIDGEDIKAVADHAQGAGQTVEPVLRATSNVLGEVGRRLVHPMTRKARIVEFKEAEFKDAEDWTVADDEAITVNAAVTGGTTVDLPEPIEFVHFGRVYRDRSPLFPCPKLSDMAGEIGEDEEETYTGSDPPAHGLMFRAALMRETILLGGFIRAQMDALLAEEKSKGVIGVLAQVLADVTGSAGGTNDKPNAVDLNPHLKKVIEAGKKINRPRVDYPALHESGVMLHTARKAYREYLVKELEKRHAPPKSPGGGILNDQVDEVNEAIQAGHDWLGGQHDPANPAKHDAVPRLTALVPPGVQDFLSLVQKISFKAWDVCAALTYEYSVRLEPIIEDAAREMSSHSIKRRNSPMFPVWFLEPQPEYSLPADVEQKIFDKVENPLSKSSVPSALGFLVDKANDLADVVTDPIKDALTKYDQKVGIDKTLDFLSRPDRYTPGRPFLDDIFLIAPDTDPPDVPDAAKRARVGWSGGLGQMAVDCFKGALDISRLPVFLEWIISKVSTVCAEFIRAVYCRLLTLKDDEQVSEVEIVEAARKHLVGNVIETILGGLDFVNNLRNFTLDIPIAEVAISVDALIGRAKEFASTKLEKFIDPVIKYAMRDLHGMIFAYRQTAIQNRALTMEVHLAQLPTVFSRMFRNVFFPLWDKVLEKTIAAVSASLAPRVLEAGQALLKARAQVEEVRGKIVQGLAALETLPATLPGVGFDFKDPKGSVNKLKDDWNPIVKNAKAAWDNAELDVTQDLGPMEGDALETSFPLQQRVVVAEVQEVTARHLQLVLPSLKWRGAALALPPGVAEGASAAAGTKLTENQLGASTALAPSSAQPSYKSGATQAAPLPHFPLGDYPLSSPNPVSPQFVPYSSTTDLGPPSSSSFGPLPSFEDPLDAPFADPGTADLPPMPAKKPSEQTQELAFGFDGFNAEETMDISGVGPSFLPPFLGNKKV